MEENIFSKIITAITTEICEVCENAVEQSVCNTEKSLSCPLGCPCRNCRFSCCAENNYKRSEGAI